MCVCEWEREREKIKCKGRERDQIKCKVRDRDQINNHESEWERKTERDWKPLSLPISQTHIRTQDHKVSDTEDRDREKKRKNLKTQEIRKGDARQR